MTLVGKREGRAGRSGRGKSSGQVPPPRERPLPPSGIGGVTSALPPPPSPWRAPRQHHTVARDSAPAHDVSLPRRFLRRVVLASLPRAPSASEGELRPAAASLLGERACDKISRRGRSRVDDVSRLDPTRLRFRKKGERRKKAKLRRRFRCKKVRISTCGLVSPHVGRRTRNLRFQCAV